MTSVPQKKPPFQWQPNNKILLFSLLMLPVLLALGCWQLQRAEEKRQILDQYQTNRQVPPVTNNQTLDSGQDQQYRLAWLQGKVDNNRVIILKA